MQLLAIGLLIPVFFFISVLLSKRKIKPRVIELTGILSLLLSFEYITLLIHPAIVNITNDTPVYEIIILIAVAAILTPAHHRIEKWLLHRLTVHKKRSAQYCYKENSSEKSRIKQMSFVFYFLGGLSFPVPTCFPPLVSDDIPEVSVIDCIDFMLVELLLLVLPVDLQPFSDKSVIANKLLVITSNLKFGKPEKLFHFVYFGK